jgi:succinate dehydrogenase / fumarate reductase flavoprotein subunit
VWSPTTGITREGIPAVPDEIASLMEEVTTAGKLVE